MFHLSLWNFTWTCNAQHPMVPWSWKSSNVLLSPVLAWILNQRIQEQSPDNPFTLKDRLTVPVVRAGQRGGLLPPLEPCASSVELGDDSLSQLRWQIGCPFQMANRLSSAKLVGYQLLRAATRVAVQSLWACHQLFQRASLEKGRFFISVHAYHSSSNNTHSVQQQQYPLISAWIYAYYCWVMAED